METTNVKIPALSPGDHEVTINYLNGFQSKFTLNEKDVCKFLKENSVLFVIIIKSICFSLWPQELATELRLALNLWFPASGPESRAQRCVSPHQVEINLK